MKAAAIRLVSSLDGLSPHVVALILATGLVLGTFPVYGCPTLFCLLAAFVLRLNLPALQVVNQLTSPLQFALLIPFARLGARIIPTPVAAPAVWKVAAAALQAITGWFVICVPLGFLLYAVLRAAGLKTPRGTAPGSCLNSQLASYPDGPPPEVLKAAAAAPA